MRSSTVKLFKWELQVPNLQEYHNLKREIFSEHHYFFETKNDTPIIVDIGAHIGLTTLYFKRLYPHSLILCFEPYLPSFSLLQHNLEFNQISRVQPLNQAVWSNHQPLTLYADRTPDQWWSTSGILPQAWDQTQTTAPYVTVPVTLKDICAAAEIPIDLVKIDAEGAEAEILFSSYTHFDHILRYVVEYHPQKGSDLSSFIQQFPQPFKLTVIKKNRQINQKRKVSGLTTIWATRL